MIKNLVHIDDDPDDQEFFFECIHSIDPTIRCTQMSDSRIALQTIMTGKLPKADIIFLDLNMPCVGGLELLLALRQTTEYSAIPVAILTTSCSGIDIDKSKELGVTYFLTKPITLHEWEVILETAVGSLR